MVDAVLSVVASTIKIIDFCVTKYGDFCAYKEEYMSFQRSLKHVNAVLKDIQQSLRTAGSASNAATAELLQQPMKMLSEAVRDGRNVVKKCSGRNNNNKVRAFVFSRQYLGMLNRARADIALAMGTLQMSGVALQDSTLTMTQTIVQELKVLDKKISAVVHASHNERVVDLIVRAMMTVHQHQRQLQSSGNDRRNYHHIRDGGGDDDDRSVDTLVSMGIVSSHQDFVEQLAKLPEEADTIRRKAKEVYDETMLNRVFALKIPPREGGGGPSASPKLSGVGNTEDPAVVGCTKRGGGGGGGGHRCGRIRVDEDALSTLTEEVTPSKAGRGTSKSNHTFPTLPSLVDTMTSEDSSPCSSNMSGDGSQKGCWWCTRVLLIGVAIAVLLGAGGAIAVIVLRAVEGAPKPALDGSRNPSPSPAASGAVDTNTSTPTLPPPSSPPNRDGIVTSPTLSPSQVRGDDVPEPSPLPSPSPSKAPEPALTESPTPASSSGAGVTTTATPTPKPAPAPAANGGPVNGSYPSSTLVGKFNATLPPSTLQRIQDSTSPQRRAYEWVTLSDQVPERDEANNETRKVLRMKQRFATATLLYAIEGLDSWVKSTVSECQWSYAGGKVACNAVASVVAVAEDVGWGGAIPPEIGLLTALTSLELTSSLLSSSIPTEVGLLTDLTRLDLTMNDITSSIPTELGLLTALTYLDLSLTELTSSIPTELGQLTKLQYVSVFGTSVTGSIPSSLCGVAGIQIDIDCFSAVSCSCCLC